MRRPGDIHCVQCEELTYSTLRVEYISSRRSWHEKKRKENMSVRFRLWYPSYPVAPLLFNPLQLASAPHGRRLDKKWALPWPCGSAHAGWANHRGAFQCPPAVDSFLECSLMPVRAFPWSEPDCRDGTFSLRKPSRTANRWPCKLQQILNSTGPDTLAP